MICNWAISECSIRAKAVNTSPISHCELEGHKSQEKDTLRRAVSSTEPRKAVCCHVTSTSILFLYILPIYCRLPVTGTVFPLGWMKVLTFLIPSPSIFELSRFCSPLRPYDDKTDSADAREIKFICFFGIRKSPGKYISLLDANTDGRIL